MSRRTLDYHGKDLMLSDQLERKAMSDTPTDSQRIDYLQSHLDSGKEVYCYLSTEGYRYRMAGHYDNHIPLHPSLREAIDAGMLREKP